MKLKDLGSTHYELSRNCICSTRVCCICPFHFIATELFTYNSLACCNTKLSLDTTDASTTRALAPNTISQLPSEFQTSCIFNALLLSAVQSYPAKVKHPQQNDHKKIDHTALCWPIKVQLIHHIVNTSPKERTCCSFLTVNNIKIWSNYCLYEGFLTEGAPWPLYGL